MSAEEERAVLIVEFDRGLPRLLSAEDERVVLIVELDLGLPLLLSAEAERLGRGVVFLVLTGVFLRVCEGVFLRSLRTMRPPMLLRRRPARCGVVLATAGMV